MENYNKLGVYIHIPFCRHLCGYCDFYKTPHLSKNIFLDYLKALELEIGSRFNFREEVCESLFLGGGTPSLLFNLEEFWKILNKFGSPAETTLECNPENLIDNISNLKNWNGARRRLSLGIQSCDQRVLDLLQRNLSLNIVKQAIEKVKMRDFEVSFDIILGVRTPFKRDIVKELSELLQSDPDHLSLYILGLNKDHHLKNLIDEDENIEREYLLVSEFLVSRGYIHYEVSNFSKPGKESAHNLRYWNREEYYGFGPSSHSFLKNQRSANQANLQKYLKNPLEIQSFTEDLTENNIRMEDMYLNLRTLRGIHKSRVTNSKINDYLEGGFMISNGDYYVCTPKGWLMLDSIVVEI